MDSLTPATETDTAVTRDASGRFLPGVSGNPAGKAPGTRNRRTLLAEALNDGEDITVARVVIDKALAGDVVAARFCVAHLSPKPKGRAIVLDLPADGDAGDVVAAFDATLAAMAAGDITPDEALTITRVLDGRRRALEAVALERRLDAELRAEEDAEAVRQAVDDLLAGNEPDEAEEDDADLHSTCISTPPSEIRAMVEALPAAERRLVAALVAQRRAAAAQPAP